MDPPPFPPLLPALPALPPAPTVNVIVPPGDTERVEEETIPPAPPPPPPRLFDTEVEAAPPPPPPPPTTRYEIAVTPVGTVQVQLLPVVTFANLVVPETVPYSTAHAAATAVGMCIKVRSETISAATRPPEVIFRMGPVYPPEIGERNSSL